MASLVQRAASRLFGLATPDAVEKLQEDVAALKTRVRMGASASGVAVTFGQFEYEYLAALSASQRWLVYDKMESDPRIKEGLDGYINPLITGKWTIQAASDKPADKDIADFVAANLLRVNSDKYGREYFTQTSWSGQRLREILDMRKCGFAMFCKSTRVVGDKVVYDRLQWLEPSSVDPHGWKLSETDVLEQVERTYRTPSLSYQLREPILAKQLAMYIWDYKGARYEGRPAIRSLYGAYTRKDFLHRSAVIWAQKAGAPPPIGHYPHTLPKEHIPLLEKLVAAVRGQAPAETMAVFPLGPNGEEVKITYPGSDAGEVDRVGSLIDREVSELAAGSGTNSRMLGQTQSGSRAVGETLSDDEDIGVQAAAEMICGMENDGVANLMGLIPELVDWNFPGVKECPRLVVSRVGPHEDFRTLDPLVKAVQAGLIPKTIEVMKQIATKLSITLKDEDYEEALAQQEESRQADIQSKMQPPVADGTPAATKEPPPRKQPLKATGGAPKSLSIVADDIHRVLIEEALALAPDSGVDAIRVTGGAAHLGKTVYVPHLNEVLLLEGWLEAEPEERVAVLVHQLEALAGPPDKDGKWTGGGGGTSRGRRDFHPERVISVVRP